MSPLLSLYNLLILGLAGTFVFSILATVGHLFDSRQSFLSVYFYYFTRVGGLMLVLALLGWLLSLQS